MEMEFGFSHQLIQNCRSTYQLWRCNNQEFWFHAVDFFLNETFLKKKMAEMYNSERKSLGYNYISHL
jgi:hypothetical protein